MAVAGRWRHPSAVVILFAVRTAVPAAVAAPIVAVHNSASRTRDGGRGKRGGEQQGHSWRGHGGKSSAILQELTTVFAVGVQVGHRVILQ
jgi:hypothetical protein